MGASLRNSNYDFQQDVLLNKVLSKGELCLDCSKVFGVAKGRFKKNIDSLTTVKPTPHPPPYL